MEILLCVVVWPAPGRLDDLVAFEDFVLGLLLRHGATVEARHAVEPRADGDPAEVQLLRFPDEESLARSSPTRDDPGGPPPATR